METKAEYSSSSEKTARERGLRVVAIGGGTGFPPSVGTQVLRAIARGNAFGAAGYFPSIADLCAVVTVSDDGGSSGRLRKEFNMLPPGDIRNCIVAPQRR